MNYTKGHIKRNEKPVKKEYLMLDEKESQKMVVAGGLTIENVWIKGE